MQFFLKINRNLLRIILHLPALTVPKSGAGIRSYHLGAFLSDKKYGFSSSVVFEKGQTYKQRAKQKFPVDNLLVFHL